MKISASMFCFIMMRIVFSHFFLFLELEMQVRSMFCFLFKSMLLDFAYLQVLFDY